MLIKFDKQRENENICRCRKTAYLCAKRPFVSRLHKYAVLLVFDSNQCLFPPFLIRFFVSRMSFLSFLGSFFALNAAFRAETNSAFSSCFESRFKNTAGGIRQINETEIARNRAKREISISVYFAEAESIIAKRSISSAAQ